MASDLAMATGDFSFQDFLESNGRGYYGTNPGKRLDTNILWSKLAGLRWTVRDLMAESGDFGEGLFPILNAVCQSLFEVFTDQPCPKTVPVMCHACWGKGS